MVTRRFSEKMIKLVRNTMNNIEYRGAGKTRFSLTSLAKETDKPMFFIYFCNY